MFGDINKVEIMGNMTQDPDLRYTPNGAAVTSFGVATNRRWKGQNDSEWQEETQFHNVVVWAKLAEGIAQRAKKGTRIYVSGRLQTRSWEDQEGKKNYKTEIIAAEVILIDRYEKGATGDFTPNQSTGATSDNQATGETSGDSAPAASKAKPAGKGKSEEIDPDDLPF